MFRALRGATSTTTRHGQQWRAFFNLAHFPSTNESKAQKFHERKLLPYRRSELYEVITDVNSYSNFVPYCTGSRVLNSEVSPDGTTVMKAELTIGFLAFRESYVSTVTCKPYESVEAVASSSTPLFKTLTTVWHLQSTVSTSPLSQGPRADPAPTLVTLDLAFAFANPMHSTASAAFFGQVSKLMVKAFEQRCVTLYGLRSH